MPRKTKAIEVEQEVEPEGAQEEEEEVEEVEEPKPEIKPDVKPKRILTEKQLENLKRATFKKERIKRTSTKGKSTTKKRN